MDLSFETIALRKICSITRYAEKKYGIYVTRSLHTRLEDLRAANTLDDLPAELVVNPDPNDPLNFHTPLKGDYILKFQPQKLGIHTGDSSVVVLSEVYRIELLAIEKIND